MKKQEQERLEAINELHELVKPGDTLYTILRHVSQSGMSRRISVYTKDMRMIDYLVAKATGFKLSNKEGLTVGGCGMDMGFHVVHNVSDVLYGGYGRSETSAGYKCLGEHGRCPSNYHANHRDTINCEGVPQYVVYCIDEGLAVEATSQRFDTREEAEKYTNTIAPDRKPEVEAEYIRCWRSDTMELPPIQITEDGKVFEPCSVDSYIISIPQGKAHTITRNGVEEICPTCKGQGRVPNPEGPERWDLIHTDGYAIRQSWL